MMVTNKLPKMVQRFFSPVQNTKTNHDISPIPRHQDHLVVNHSKRLSELIKVTAVSTFSITGNFDMAWNTKNFNDFVTREGKQLLLDIIT